MFSLWKEIQWHKQTKAQAVSLVHSFCSATPLPLSTSEVSGPLFHTYAHMGGGCWSEVTVWQGLVSVEMRALSASPTGHRCKGGCPLWLSPWQLPRQRQAPVITFAKVMRLDRSKSYGQAPSIRQMSSWHWRATAPLNFRCLHACPSLSCRCTDRWRSHLRWTDRPRPPRSPPGCRRSRLGGPSHWTVSDSPSAACGLPYH